LSRRDHPAANITFTALCYCGITLYLVLQVPHSFPLLSHIGIINAAGAAASAAAASQALERQLPGLLQQVRQVVHA
jgi:hypothetical protein